MQQPPSSDLKLEIRRAVRARRSTMTSADRASAARDLTPRLIALCQASGARSVACFAALPTEPDTTGFLDWAFAADLDVMLPVSLPNSQLAWVKYDGTPLRAGRHGILEPIGPRLEGEMAFDLMFIPACAVDDSGTRLGWGMGYYDRFLATAPASTQVFAVVFDDDRYAKLPRDPHDVPVTGAVSPGGVTRVLSGSD